MLRINLLGGVEILYKGKHLETTLSSKSVAILTMLVTSAPSKLTRSKLAETLWAENYDSASYNLRYNLWSIKKSIPTDDQGRELILTNKEYCYINPDYSFICDLDCFKSTEKNTLSEKSTSELELMKNSFNGDFLEDFYIKDAEEYYEWILINRVNYQKLYLEVLKQLAKRYLQRRHYNELVDVLEDVLKMSPYDEDIHYQLMEAYVKLGESIKAISQYKKCDAILRSDLNIGPEQKLKDLYLRLISQRDNISPEDKKADRDTLEINKHPNKYIEYYGISDLIKGIKPFIIKAKRKEELNYYKETLGYIDPYFRRGNIPITDISLFIALSEIINQIWSEETLAIKIYNKDKLDSKSKVAFEYLENNLNVEKITISYEK